MSSDISRQRFNPANDFNSVLMQQGRVQLDADWNEWNEILDRRWRSETIDIIGRCVVPLETPDGFEIQLSGGSLTIGRGRIYVDGLQAENHGAGDLEFDPILAESRGVDPIPYEQQPYFPNRRRRCPKQAGRISFISMSGNAKSRTSKTRICVERRSRRSIRRRVCKPSGRCAFCPTSATTRLARRRTSN